MFQKIKSFIICKQVVKAILTIQEREKEDALSDLGIISSDSSMYVLEAPIQAVNVYTNRARITRRGRIYLQRGEHLITVPDLPHTLENETVRATCLDTTVKIIDVEVTVQTMPVVVPPELAKLQVEFDQLQDQDEALLDEDRVEADRLTFLQDIRQSASHNLGQSIVQGHMQLDEIDKLMDYVAIQQRNALKRRREIVAIRRQLEEAMRDLQDKSPTGHQLKRRTLPNSSTPQPTPSNNSFGNDNPDPPSRPSPFRRPVFGNGSNDNNENPNEGNSPFSRRPFGSAPRSDNRRKTIQMSVQVEEDTEFELTVIYTVGDASWEPFYDIRVVDGHFIVSCMAQIRQRTGEDWPAVPIILSTMRPMQNANMPKIRPWVIDAEENNTASNSPFSNRPSFGSSSFGNRFGNNNNNENNPPRFSSSSPFRRSSSPPPPPPPPAPRPFLGRLSPSNAQPERTLELESGEINGSAPTVTFEVQQPLAVPADNSVRKAFLTTVTFDGELEYIAIPSQTEEVYLCAKVKNTSEMTLLPGSALIFYDARYIGKTELKAVAPDDTFAIQIGEQDRIRVQRQLSEHAASKPSNDEVSRTEFIYRITITNDRPEPVSLTVYDHLPVTRHKDIKVLIRAITPQPSEQTDLNIFKWRVHLEPEQRQEIVLGFALEHPRDMKIVSKR